MTESRSRRLWRLACKWRRYRGYSHGRSGGIDVDPSVALEASIVMPVVMGDDILSICRVGRYLRVSNEVKAFFLFN